MSDQMPDGLHSSERALWDAPAPTRAEVRVVLGRLARTRAAQRTPTPLPLLVGLCPNHLGESYAPVDPADPDPKCPACGCRLLVYAPRGSVAGASDEALAGKGGTD